ncbi:LacI family transcriptional regulator [Capsulimonas corticalis]|uniref:LacI family transcriptional regulator n=2 Tax=Capsulimonas corticalis TaxID=2219043 RepID=A0A402CRY9_9BACT|nr:LacI family transcriptional regulator [Capsulimonas corticalis]
MSNIHEVARHAGVSPATVSRTFRTPELIAQQTRRRVLRAADTLNYQPRVRAAGLEADTHSESVTAAIGFLLFTEDPDSGEIDEFYAPILMGAQAEADRFGMHLILRTASRFEPPRETHRPGAPATLAGSLLVGSAEPEALAAHDCQSRIAVLVDNRDRTGQRDCVVSDCFGGMQAAVQHLLDLGRRRIAIVEDVAEDHRRRERLQGYRHALWEAGISPPLQWIVSAPPSAGLTPYFKLLDTPARPTAIAVASDASALAALAACRALGLCVPHDISIVSFDDTALSRQSYPALTTARVNKAQMGRLAVRQLAARIREAEENVDPLPCSAIVVPMSLIVRASTGRALGEDAASGHPRPD